METVIEHFCAFAFRACDTRVWIVFSGHFLSHSYYSTNIQSMWSWCLLISFCTISASRLLSGCLCGPIVLVPISVWFLRFLFLQQYLLSQIRRFSCRLFFLHSSLQYICLLCVFSYSLPQQAHLALGYLMLTFICIIVQGVYDSVCHLVTYAWD